jgi:hypothetical protein
MNKLFLFFGVFLLSIATVLATAAPTVVSGHVYDQDGKTRMPNVEVSVTCDNGESVEGPLYDTTNANGFYVVEFLENCPTGSLITVHAGDNEESANVGNTLRVNKNIVYINISIPEFGVIAAGVAAAGGVLGFMLLRKRN